VETLTQPYTYEFFRNGVAVATVAGGLCGLIGCFIVLRSMSYIGHGLSHAVFGGFAVAGLAGVNVFVGAGAWGVATAILIGVIARRRPVGADAAIGLVTTASFALGLALIDRYGSPARNPDAVLFGSVLGVTTGDVVMVVAVAVVALVVLAAGYRRLLFVTFDAEVARVSGVNVGVVDVVLMTVLAATVLATMSVLGVTLIAAALVVPAVVARMLTASFPTLLGLAATVGAACGFVGMNASYHLDVASGPAIVLVGAAAFAVVYASGGLRQRRRFTAATTAAR
jgi:ABC-type Mn2+/Zn2+ transport system permease subunit